MLSYTLVEAIDLLASKLLAAEKNRESGIQVRPHACPVLFRGFVDCVR